MLNFEFHCRRIARSGLAVSPVFLLLAVATISFAQATISTGSIQGTITDPSGAVVGGAKVTISNTATGSAIHVSSNSSGSYNSGALTPGNYSVKVEAGGFKTAELPVLVQVNVTSSGNLKLQLGQASEVVEVQGGQVQVNTEQAEVQGVLNTDQIENLPVNGGNFLDLAQLEPGVQIQDGANFDPTKVGYSSISFGGRFGRTARIEVDGVDVSDETVGTTTENVASSSIQEFSLAQSTLDLSNDLTTSGAVNVDTRYGTNRFHGEAFGQFRDESALSAQLPHPIDACPGCVNVNSPFQRTRVGGNLGGPILKDKLFFFFDGEHITQHLEAPVSEPDPFTAFSGTFAAPYKDGEALARVDYQLSDNMKIFGKYSYFDNSVYATFFPSSFQVYDNKDYTHNLVGGWDYTKGGFTHSVRFSYLEFHNAIYDAVRNSDLPFADYPVSINIGDLSTGPNFLAPQQTLQSNHQAKYDGSKALGKHILRYGIGLNHILGGGFASFFQITPNVYSNPISGQTNPLSYMMTEVILGDGQGFSTTQPSFGYPAGALGPDNRLGVYFGDTWKVLPNLTITPGLRYVRDTGRTDSDLPADPTLNTLFPGYGNRVNQPNLNFAPQLGLVWDPKSTGKTVIRAGSGLFYEDVIFNNVLFDRPLRLPNGAFLQDPVACFNGSALPVSVPVTAANPTGTITVPTDPTTGMNYCAETIQQAAGAIAAFQAMYQSMVPFNLSAPNPSYLNTLLSEGVNVPLGLFAPNYKTPRSVQMNAGIQHEIRPGMIFSADYLRNVETHTLLSVDINHTGDVRYFNKTAAAAAIATTNSHFGCPAGEAGITCAIANGATMADYAMNGLSSAQDFGGACIGTTGEPCAFGGLNPSLGEVPFLEPVGRSTYDALQAKLAYNKANPIRGIKAANLTISYSLSRFDNPMASQGTTAPSTPVSISDQDFVNAAADNNNPLKYFGPSLLDRTHQISFGGYFDVPYHFRFGLISHFDSPLSSPVIVGNTGLPGDIFRTDFDGDGTISDPLPGTTNGSFGRSFGVSGLNNAIANYNATYANQPTPAGMVLINNGLFTLAQLQALGGVAPTLNPAPGNQLPFTWLRTMDLKLSWIYNVREKVTFEPNIAFYNAFNFANYDLPPGVENGWLSGYLPYTGNPTCPSLPSCPAQAVGPSSGSINTSPLATAASRVYRVGVGTGVYALGAPRIAEFGLKATF